MSASNGRSVHREGHQEPTAPGEAPDALSEAEALCLLLQSGAGTHHQVNHGVEAATSSESSPASGGGIPPQIGSDRSVTLQVQAPVLVFLMMIPKEKSMSHAEDTDEPPRSLAERLESLTVQLHALTFPRARRHRLGRQ